MALASGTVIGGGWKLDFAPEVVTASNVDQWEQPLENTKACAKLRGLATKTGVIVGNVELYELYRPPLGWSAASVSRNAANGSEEVAVAWMDTSGNAYIPAVCSEYGSAIASTISGSGWLWLLGLAAAGVGLYYVANDKKKKSKKGAR